MAARKRRVSGSTTNTILWVGVALVGGFALYEIMKSQQPTTTVIRTTTPASSSAATTAAEVAAGSSVLTSIANDLFNDDSDT